MLFGRRSKEKPGGEKTEQRERELARTERSRRIMDELCRAAHQTDEESKEKRLKERVEFLDTTRAVPLEPHIYALWLY